MKNERNMNRSNKIPLTQCVQRKEEDDGSNEIDGKDISSEKVSQIDTESHLKELSCSSEILKCCCRGKSCWKEKELFDSECYPHPFRFYDLVATLGSLTFFFYDVVSDVLLAFKYYTLERWTAFGFTATFIVMPLVIVNLTSLRWYMIDFNQELSKCGRTDRLEWFFRVTFTFPLFMGQAVRQVEYIYNGWKFRCSRPGEGSTGIYYKAMITEHANAAMMRMYEAFLESAPQLVFQMYVILTESSNEESLVNIIRPIAMAGSWICVSGTLVSSYKSLRVSNKTEEPGLSIFGTIFYYIWRACEVGPRMLVLALFASYFTYWMLVVVAVHWIVMVAWVTVQNPQIYKKPLDKVVFTFLISFVMVFCFQNVQKGPTRFRQLVYYIILYGENLAMLILWSYFTPAKNEWYYFTAIGVVPGALLLHICVQVIYYKFHHPNGENIDFNLNFECNCIGHEIII